MKHAFLSIFALMNLVTSSAQDTVSDPKVILITIDGLRWQELFGGADSILINSEKYTKRQDEIKDEFWRENPIERRKRLMPFVWGEVEKMGQIHGNRQYESRVNLTNGMWFSYPGYNEMLTGIADDEHINSNQKNLNPNITILEMAQNNPSYRDRVAVFSSWEVFPYIINEERSKVPVNSGFEPVSWEDINPNEEILNKLMDELPKPWGFSGRFDAITHNLAMEHLKKWKPKFLFVAYGDVDHHGHDGNYSSYLEGIKVNDSYIKEIWEYTQGDSFYKDQTLFVITTDHGRGTTPLESWRSHGSAYKNSDEVWMMFMGSGVRSKGEITTEEQLYTNQLAMTILEYLGIDGIEPKMGMGIELRH